MRGCVLLHWEGGIVSVLLQWEGKERVCVIHWEGERGCVIKREGV